jgi:signal peptidase I
MGQFIQGRAPAAALWLGGFVAIVVLVAMVRMFSAYVVMLGSLLLVFALACASACDAFFFPVAHGRRSPPRFLIGLPLAVAFLFACVTWNVLLVATGFRLYNVPSSAMEPTIEKGDAIIADMHAYQGHAPDRGDIVTMSRARIIYVKRVIGLPGDEVSISGGVVSINSQPISEPYVEFTEGPEAFGRNFPATRIPDRSYFVMGDHRDISLDSRSEQFGLATKDEIKGRVLYIFNSGRVGRRIDRDQPSHVPGGPHS